MKRKRNKKKNVSAQKKFLDFHWDRSKANTTTKKINLNQTLMLIGKVPVIVYDSPKSGKMRTYEHKLRKHGTGYVTADGKTFIITDLSLNVRKEGLTG